MKKIDLLRVLFTATISTSLFTTVLGNRAANAITFNFDFETAPNGDPLDAYLIDGDGQTIGSTLYSTTLKNVHTIWNSIGINITVNSKNNKPLGLFQSNCLPLGGFSNNGFTAPCNVGTENNGDPDLATGDGGYGSITYNTPPQGNVLIIEENPGTNRRSLGSPLGVPDDDGGGGKIRFDFDRTILSSVKIGQIGLIDDVKGSIFVKYLDTTSNFTQNVNLTTENALTFFEPTDGQIDYLEVNFDGSGAISGVFFSEFDFVATPVPEPSTIIATLVSLGFGGILKKRASLNRTDDK